MTTLPSLDAIQARADAATNGPWEINGPDERWAAISSGPDSVIHAYTEHASDCVGCTCERDADVAISAEDAEFIAAARADVPVLVAALHAVLDVADQFDRLAARHPDSETGQVETAAAHEIRRAVTAHIDTTPREKP